MKLTGIYDREKHPFLLIWLAITPSPSPFHFAVLPFLVLVLHQKVSLQLLDASTAIHFLAKFYSSLSRYSH